MVELQLRLAARHRVGREIRVLRHAQDDIAQLSRAASYLQRAGFPAPVVSRTNDEQKGRMSTNDRVRTIDEDFPLAAGEDKRDDFVDAR